MKLFILDRDNWQEVAQTLGRNKRRSIATAFGIFWGVFMLIILLSLSTGVGNAIHKATSTIGDKTAFFDTRPTSLPYKGFKSGRWWHLNEKDLDILRARIPEIKDIATMTNIWAGGKQNTFLGQVRASSMIMGVTDDYFKIYKQIIIAGRGFNRLDHVEDRRVCLLSKKLATHFAPRKNYASLIGRTIKADKLTLTIVGVTAKENDMFNVGYQAPFTIYTPYSMLAKAKNTGGRIEDIMLSFYKSTDEMKKKEEVSALLKELHDVAPNDDKAISATALSEITSVFENVGLGLNLLIWIVGLGTLFTGVVSISNILLVTVRERTQEIGVRRAMGAKPRDIIRQLLLEASTLSVLSGMGGLVLGVGVMSIVNSVMGNSMDGDMPLYHPVINLSTAIGIVLIITFCGILAGLLPAYKALEIKAIEAIQEE